MYELAYQFCDGVRTDGPVDVTKSGMEMWDLGHEGSGTQGCGMGRRRDLELEGVGREVIGIQGHRDA